MANIYSHDFIKKMIDNNNIDIVNLVAQLPCVSADWMLEYAIEQKKSKIAKSTAATGTKLKFEVETWRRRDIKRLRLCGVFTYVGL